MPEKIWPIVSVQNDTMKIGRMSKREDRGTPHWPPRLPPLSSKTSMIGFLCLKIFLFRLRFTFFPLGSEYSFGWSVIRLLRPHLTWLWKVSGRWRGELPIGETPAEGWRRNVKFDQKSFCFLTVYNRQQLPLLVHVQITSSQRQYCLYTLIFRDEKMSSAFKAKINLRWNVRNGASIKGIENSLKPYFLWRIEDTFFLIWIMQLALNAHLIWRI